MKHALLHLAQILFWIVYCSYAIASLLIGASARQSSGLPFRSFIVTTGSMLPMLTPGDVIFTREAPEYAVHDVITFRGTKDSVITHRIIEKKTTDAFSYTTKGDNNKTKDVDPVSQDKVIGKLLFSIPKIGKVLLYASSRPGVFILIVTPLVVIAASEVFKKQRTST